MMTSTPFKAAEFIEYLNGDDNTPMGRFRKENEVTRNRKVRFIELDNEAEIKWTALQYAEQVVNFTNAMKAVDPEIKTMMMIYSFDNGAGYLEQMLKIAGKHIDYIIDRSSSPESVNRTLKILRTFNNENGTSIKLTNTEWRAGGNSPEPFEDPDVPQRFGWRPQLQDSYKKVLSYRQIHWFYALNGAAKLLDYLSFGGEYYLANFNNCVNTWGQNVIEASKEGAWLSPMGEVFRFFSSEEEKFPLQIRLSANFKDNQKTDDVIEMADPMNPDFPLIVNRQSETEFYKVAACETNEGINIYFVNKSLRPVRLSQILPRGYSAVIIDELHGQNQLSRTYINKTDLVMTSSKIKNTTKIDIMPLSVNRIKVINSK